MIRPITQIVRGMPATDGSGVNLRRILGTEDMDYLDPFLLLDEFKSDNPDDYIGGFPDHPHRGFETVTYLMHGKFKHRDSRGNEGVLTPGSVQWMTAGRGIIHSEMPEMSDGLLWGFQLWVNLPKEMKMIEPHYQNIPADRIPEVNADGSRIRIISGEYGDINGPAKTRIPVVYFDVHLVEMSTFAHPLPSEMSGFCYLYEGKAEFGPQGDTRMGREGQMMVLGDGESVRIRSGKKTARFLFLAARPLNEPIARGGPFVMNTESEVRQAFLDYGNGTFDK
ncbi:MAG: pirin family protein [Candidatus Neomarinimicrobiota bacterium]